MKVIVGILVGTILVIAMFVRNIQRQNATFQKQVGDRFESLEKKVAELPVRDFSAEKAEWEKFRLLLVDCGASFLSPQDPLMSIFGRGGKLGFGAQCKTTQTPSLNLENPVWESVKIYVGRDGSITNIHTTPDGGVVGTNKLKEEVLVVYMETIGRVFIY